MNLSDFHYDLPEHQIAQEPVTPRDHSRLMGVDRLSGAIRHLRFDALPSLLQAHDVLVLNATKVFPARLRGKKKTGGKIEVLFLRPEAPGWLALVRGTTKATDLVFPEGLEAQMTERTSQGEWILQFSSNHLVDYLDRYGEMPLPLYIKRPARQTQDRDRYQTVFAKETGSVAAPTAGFHFTPELLATLKAKGVQIQEVVLHVGWGTFRPVRSELIEVHQMLPEHYYVSKETAQALNEARAAKRRIIAVGTTVVRTLESSIQEDGTFCAGPGETSLYIYPGYRFKVVDALITNFHLPDSTPLLLACAFASDLKSPPAPLFQSGESRYETPPLEKGGRGDFPFTLKRAYQTAVQEGYRFYSYGDAMFIS